MLVLTGSNMSAVVITNACRLAMNPCVIGGSYRRQGKRRWPFVMELLVPVGLRVPKRESYFAASDNA